MNIVKVPSIRSPQWNGGKACIGIAEYRFKPDDIVEVEVTYTNARGERPYPGKYRMEGHRLVKYPTKTVGGGVRLHVAPISAWDSTERRPRIKNPSKPRRKEMLSRTEQQQLF